jgi:dTDP-4-dehydrorhamnose reductase
VIVRTAWLYGPDGRNFPRTMLELAKNRDEVRVVDDQRSSPTYAPHLAAAIAKLLDAPQWGIWHLAGHGDATWYDLTRELYRLAEVRTRVVPVTTDEFPRPAKRPANSVLETERQPPILLPPWAEGLAEFVAAVEPR